MNNGFNNNNNDPSTGTNGKFDFFPPDNGMNGNNQGVPQNGGTGMGLNQNMNSGNVNGGGMQNTYTGVNYMNSGNNVMNGAGMNNVGQMNGMQGGMAQQGMSQQAMPQMGMNQSNMMQQNVPQPGMPQPMQMGFGNQPGVGGTPNKGKKKSKMTLVVATIVAVVVIFVLNANGGYDLTCTGEVDEDFGKAYAKIQYKINKGGKSLIKSEFKYKYDDLDDEEVENLYNSLTYSNDEAEELNVNGTTKMGSTFLGDNTIMKRKGNTIIITSETYSDEDDKIDKEYLEKIKESAKDNDLTCK